MNKWYGKIGYAVCEEVEAGVWEDTIVEKPYFGDIVRNTRRLQNSGGINDNISISNQISIVADPYAVQNINNMRYIEFMGTNWKVANVEVQYPRLLLDMGEVWNGNTGTVTE